MSQREAIAQVITRNKSGITKAQIVTKTGVPEGNILSHIATLRHKYKMKIKTDRREVKGGGKKVFFMLAASKMKKAA